MLLAPLDANAVIVYGDHESNTNAPSGALTDSGWQFQGRFRQYLGTPIAPHHFITAGHFGGATNETFYFDDNAYTIINKNVDADSDLVLYEVSGTFSR